jgi:peptide subunit release factor 1 (eRF1)
MRRKKEENVDEKNMKELDSTVDTDKNVAVYQRSNSIEEIEIVIVTKFLILSPQNRESLKVVRDFPTNYHNDNTKRIKLSNVSHLQLMQDVVALIDNLITKVCDMVSQKEKTSGDDIMIISSDESNESKLQKKKLENKSMYG